MSISKASKLKAKQITQAFLGSQSDLEQEISKGRLATYAPELEIFIKRASEKLLAIVKTSDDPKLNPVYHVTNIEILDIVYRFERSTGGYAVFYKVPIEE